MIPSLAGRLFIALPIPESTRSALSNHLQQTIGSTPLPGRAVSPRNWHFTLHFLGKTDQETAEAICHVLESIDLGEAFEVEIAGAGAFPSLHRAKALWLAVERGREEMENLAAVIHKALVRAGFPGEDRPFRPHLTLRRFKQTRDMREIAETIGDARTRMSVTNVVLYRSHLGHGPPRYEELRTFPLN